MVATRRGGRAIPSGKGSPDRNPDVPATPSTPRRTRRTVNQSESPSHQVPPETCCYVEEAQSEASSSSTRRRCARASRLHSPEQPPTPVGSIHDGDESDLESGSSVASAHEAVLTRSLRVRLLRRLAPESEEVSEVESCSSVVSASKNVQSVRQSTRRRAAPSITDAVDAESTAGKQEQEMEPESGRVTRSQRRPPRTRSTTKKPTEESALSDAESCASSMSEADLSMSASHRVTRSRRKICPIPIQLTEASESPRVAAGAARRTRVGRRKAAPPADAEVIETPSCDSDGFESGPTYCVGPRRSVRTRANVLDSDSEVMEVQSPVSTRSRGTPCSSRTGSGSSSRNALTRTRPAGDSVAVTVEPGKDEPSLNESRLETTLTAEDADRTLQEEETSQTSPEVECVENTDVTCEAGAARNDDDDDDDVVVLSHESPIESVVCTEEPAVSIQDQQEEPPAETKASEVEMMQENVESSEPAELCQSVTVTECETDSQVFEPPEEQQQDLPESLQNEEKDEEVEAVDPELSEEKMEVSLCGTDVQKVEQQEDSEDTGDSEDMVDSEDEQEPKPRKVISLLDSTDDEDEDEDAAEEEELEVPEDKVQGESSKRSEAASSVDGLFMIDTRPGQEADEQYYKELNDDEATCEDAKTQNEKQQQEDDEEFVDEEADDEEDEDANALFSGRTAHLKDLSSRIDPGINMKELGGLYISFDGSKSKAALLQKQKKEKIQDQLMKKSVIGPDFEKKEAVPPYSESKRALKLKRKAEREKSAGDPWFNMKAPEITQELKGDLQVLKMRGSLDPKRFYKKNDRDGFPKYFQVGTVVDNPIDFYHSRIPKKERKRTMVEELLADAEFRQQNKKQYKNIMAERAAQTAGKRFKKNKFHKK